MRKGILRLCGMIIIASTCWSGLLAQTSSISISNLNSIPKVLYDTVAYDLDFYIINESLTQKFNSPVTVKLSVNGDEGTSIIVNASPPMEIFPGDSFLVSVSNYFFDLMRFSSGGGLSHDIIVWPMVVGNLPGNPLIKTVVFEYSPNSISHSLGIINPAVFPAVIAKDLAYDFDFEVMNIDPVKPLYHSIEILMSIDGQAPIALVSNISLEEPLGVGSSITIPVKDFNFSANLFGPGGGLSHDIIVWPMAIGVTHPDSLIYDDIPFVNKLSISLPTDPPKKPVFANLANMISMEVLDRPNAIKFEITLADNSGWENLEIQRYDPRIGFISIDNKNLDHQSLSTYSLTDIHPVNGEHQYRVTTTDVEGNSVIVNEFSHHFGFGDMPQLLQKGYSAENQTFEVELILLELDEITFTLMSLDGREVLKESILPTIEHIKQSWSLSHLASGLYLYQFSANGVLFQGKILR